MMTIFVFGNPTLPMDSLPLRLLPRLREMFPEVEFTVLDPIEEWDIPPHMVIIDTVVGIPAVMVFRDLSAFAASAHVSVHDFDAYANLRLLKKLGKLGELTIIGVPDTLDEDVALKDVGSCLRETLRDLKI